MGIKLYRCIFTVIKKVINVDIGDIVQIKQGTEYYRNSSVHNPKETNGVVSDFEEDDVYFYRVQWANGQNNVYRESDLVLIRKKDGGSTEKTLETLEKENKELKELVAKLQKENKELKELKEQPKRKKLLF